MLLLPRTPPLTDRMKKTDGLSVILVDMQQARGIGLTIRPIRTLMNHVTTEVFFDHLRAPAEDLIGDEGKGFCYIRTGMNAERILIAAEVVGDAKWFIDRATAYARERVVPGRPIGHNQGIQFPIARAYTNMRAAKLMVREALRQYDDGANPGPEANMARTLAADASFEAANMCFQTHGGRCGCAGDQDRTRGGGQTARHYDATVQGTSAYFAWLNRGKESAVLHLKAAKYMVVFLAMLSHADVLVQNLIPGAMARVGPDPVSAAARFSRLIVANIGGYGQDTANAGMRAYDILVQAESGIAGVNGTPDEACKIGVSAADINTGLTADARVLEALLSRSITGRGRQVDVAMFDVMADRMAVPLLHYEQAARQTCSTG